MNVILQATCQNRRLVWRSEIRVWCARKCDREGGPLIAAGARRRHRPAMQLDEAFDEREANSESSMGPLRRPVALSKRLKDVGQEFSVDPLSVVANDEPHGVARLLQLDHDLAAD